MMLLAIALGLEEKFSNRVINLAHQKLDKQRLTDTCRIGEGLMPMPTEVQVLKHNFNKRWHEKYEHTIAAKIEAFHFCKKKS